MRGLCLVFQVQGMSFIAAVLLLNMDVADAFICFANLLNRPCQVAFFRIDEAMVRISFTGLLNVKERKGGKVREWGSKQRKEKLRSH